MNYFVARRNSDITSPTASGFQQQILLHLHHFITRLALGLLTFVQLPFAENPKAIFPKKHFEVLEDYCLDCHDTATEKGKINLENLSFDISKDIPAVKRDEEKYLIGVRAGDGAGFKHGCHLMMDAPKTHLCNLWLSTLKGSGIQTDSFGDSNGVIDELFEA